MEGYSLDKWRNATKQDLPPEQKKKLETYEAFIDQLGKLDEKLEKGDISSARHAVASILNLAHAVRYFSGRDYADHMKLREAYADTKEGQEMLAHQEATNVNQRYDTLVDDAEDARKTYAQSLEKVKAFAAENLNKDEPHVLADLEAQKELPRRTPRNEGPSLKEQLKRLIP